MAVLFNRVPLAAVLGLAIGRIACADTMDLPQAGTFPTPGVDASFVQSFRSQPVVPPLRLALALTRDRQHEAPLSSAIMQDAAAIQPISLIHPSRAADLSPAVTRADAVFAASERVAPQVPPLRLALALNGDKLRTAYRPAEAAREPVTRLAEQPGNTDAPPEKKTDTPPGEPAQTWEISPSDRTLNTTLARWSASAGWQLVWDMEVDYPIETRAVLQGTFQEAVATVAQSLAAASVPVQATFYDGNRVLRIVAKGSK